MGLGQCSRGLTVGRAADRQVAGTSSYLSPNAGPPQQPVTAELRFAFGHPSFFLLFRAGPSGYPCSKPETSAHVFF